MGIAANLQNLNSEILAHVRIIAVSKTRTAEEIIQAYHAGQRLFGENRAQEMAEKQPLLPGDIEWHFVGHLQSNKVKYIAPFVSMIHSIDDLKLLKEIDKEAIKNNRKIDCLLQFHIATEEAKYGFRVEEATDLLSNPDFKKMTNTRICGVMGMATFTDDLRLVRSEFKQLKGIYDTLKSKYFQQEDAFCEISMGMSDDYYVAIEEGSTIVRIGTAIFGERV